MIICSLKPKVNTWFSIFLVQKPLFAGCNSSADDFAGSHPDELSVAQHLREIEKAFLNKTWNAFVHGCTYLIALKRH